MKQGDPLERNVNPVTPNDKRKIALQGPGGMIRFGFF